MRQEMLSAVNTGKYKTNTCLFLKRMDDLDHEENAMLDEEEIAPSPAHPPGPSQPGSPAPTRVLAT